MTQRMLETRYGDKIDIVGIACSGEESLTLARLLAPEVVLMDLNMPGMGGLGTIPLLLMPAIERRRTGQLPAQALALADNGEIHYFCCGRA